MNICPNEPPPPEPNIFQKPNLNSRKTNPDYISVSTERKHLSLREVMRFTGQSIICHGKEEAKE